MNGKVDEAGATAAAVITMKTAPVDKKSGPFCSEW
jgi:hypothetical protein